MWGPCGWPRRRLSLCPPTLAFRLGAAASSSIWSSALGLQVLLMAMKDMNIAKLTSNDVPLFNAIIHDLFPGIECPVIDYGKVCP